MKKKIIVQSVPQTCHLTIRDVIQLQYLLAKTVSIENRCWEWQKPLVSMSPFQTPIWMTEFWVGCSQHCRDGSFSDIGRPVWPHGSNLAEASLHPSHTSQDREFIQKKTGLSCEFLFMHPPPCSLVTEDMQACPVSRPIFIPIKQKLLILLPTLSLEVEKALHAFDDRKALLYRKNQTLLTVPWKPTRFPGNKLWWLRSPSLLLFDEGKEILLNFKMLPGSNLTLLLLTNTATHLKSYPNVILCYLNGTQAFIFAPIQ